MTKAEREKFRLDRAIRKERRELKRRERESRRSVRLERRRRRELSKSRPIPRIESNSYNMPSWAEIRTGRVTVITPDGIRRIPITEADEYTLESRQDALGETIRMDKAENDRKGQLSLF